MSRQAALYLDALSNRKKKNGCPIMKMATKKHMNALNMFVCGSEIILCKRDGPRYKMNKRISVAFHSPKT